MDRFSLQNFIALGEGFTTEFKRSGTSHIGRELCAFANATGGVLFMGVTDRVEIISPGGLPADMQEKDLGEKSIPRNPLLFSMLYRMDLVEQIGSGIKRIRKLCHDYGIKTPKIIIEDNWFTIIFTRDKAEITPPITPPVTPPITELERKILDLIIENPLVSSQELADLLLMRRDTVKEYLGRLKGKGLLLREGSTRSGRWIVVVEKL